MGCIYSCDHFGNEVLHTKYVIWLQRIKNATMQNCVIMHAHQTVISGL